MNILRKHTIVLVLLTILISMTVGGALSSTLMMEDGSMHDCPYMGIAALCTMTALEHLSQWQQMFSTIVQQLSLFVFLLMLAIIIAFRPAKDPLVFAESPPMVIARYRYGENVIDRMCIALARGLIHPKIL